MQPTDDHRYGCPYCGSENSVLIDFTAGSRQNFVTDCEICCRPISIFLSIDGDSIQSFDAQME